MRRLASLTFFLLLGAPLAAQGSMPLSCGCGAPHVAYTWGSNQYIGQSATAADCFTDSTGSKCTVVGTISLLTYSWSSPVWGTFYFNGQSGTTYTSTWGMPDQNLSSPGANTANSYTHPSGSGSEAVCDQPGAFVWSKLLISGDRVDFVGSVVREDLWGWTLWACEEF